MRNLIVELLHSVGAVLSHFLRDMTVHIQRKLSGCVSKIGLHRFNIVPGIEGSDGKAVAQVMESGILRNPGTLANCLEVLYNCAADEILSQRIGKHQMKRIAP